MAGIVKFHYDLLSSMLGGKSSKEDPKEQKTSKTVRKTPEEKSKNKNVVKEKIIKRRMSQEEWTENDTMDMLDMMESALTRVKRGLSRKLGRFGNKKGETVASDASVESLDTLETYVTSAQTNTINVVEEINKVMQIMAEVTVEMGDDIADGEEDLDLDENDTVVGQLLQDEGDADACENWQHLVRKLSKKHKKSQKKRNKKDEDSQHEGVEIDPDTDGVIDNSEEDDVPEDWKPDFIPRTGSISPKNAPDLIPRQDNLDESSDDDAIQAIVRYRSGKRRYLKRQMGDMRRNSLASETFNEEEEIETERFSLI